MKWILTAALFLICASVSDAQAWNSFMGSDWTWPGDLRSHMQKHGVDTSNVSTKKLVEWHDHIHNVTQKGTPDRTDVNILVAQCPDGNCPPGFGFGFGFGGGMHASPPPRPPAQQRSPPQQEEKVEGVTKIRVKHPFDGVDYAMDLGSTVCVGFGREKGEWIFLTASHNLENATSQNPPEILIRGQWVQGEILYKDRLPPKVQTGPGQFMRTSDGPDRAIVAIKSSLKLKFRNVDYSHNGTVIGTGYPGGARLKSICGEGQFTGNGYRVTWQEETRQGMSGGPVFNPQGEVVGVISGGFVVESVRSFLFCFSKLGWIPGNWPPIDSTPQVPDAVEPPLIEPEPGPEPTPVPSAEVSKLRADLLRLQDRVDTLYNRVKELDCDCEDGVSISHATIEGENLILVRSDGKEIDAGKLPKGPQGPTGRSGKDGTNGNPGKDGTNGSPGRDGKDGAFVASAKIRSTDSHLILVMSNGKEIDAGKLPITETGDLPQRVAALEKRIKIPFEAQLFFNGKPTSPVRSVDPHGGWLPIDLPWEEISQQLEENGNGGSKSNDDP